MGVSEKEAWCGAKGARGRVGRNQSRNVSRWGTVQCLEGQNQKLEHGMEGRGHSEKI